MKKHILYIVVAIFVLCITRNDSVARAPRVSPVDFLGVSGVKFSPTNGQVEVSLRSNMRKAFTLIEGSDLVLEEDVCRVTLTEQVRIEPRSQQVLNIKFGFEVRPLGIMAIMNTEKVRIKFNVKYKIGKTKRLRTFRYETEVSTDNIKKYMNL